VNNQFSLTWRILSDALKRVVPDEEDIKDEQDDLKGHDPPEHVGRELLHDCGMVMRLAQRRRSPQWVVIPQGAP
jgi:hypothetical protein